MFAKMMLAKISTPSAAIRVLALLAVIALGLSGCQGSGAQPEVVALPSPVTAVQMAEVPITVDIMPWAPTGETQVVSNGVAFAWHDIAVDPDNIYFVYTLVSDTDANGLAEAVPVAPVLRTDPSPPPRQGRAVPLTSWQNASTGVLVFPGCIEDGQYMQIEFDKVATDHGEHEGPWALKVLQRTPGSQTGCGSTMSMPNGALAEFADKTASFNSGGIYLGNMAYDTQRIAKNLPPSPPEVDPALIPANAYSLVPSPDEIVPTIPPGTTPTPVPLPPYLERVTLRIVDEPSQAVQFVVITINRDGTVEGQTYEGIANRVESLLPTVPPSPISP